jgi:RNA polymerase sigma-70 factor (ECF subfamily)
MFSIAANRVKSRYSARSASEALALRVEREAAIAEEPDDDGPESSVLDAIAGEALRAAVASLPAPYRAPVELHYFAGLGVSDTARALGLGEEAVKTRLFRARKTLASILAEKRQPTGPRKGRP